jgi:hypothetical protein
MNTVRSQLSGTLSDGSSSRNRIGIGAGVFRALPFIYGIGLIATFSRYRSSTGGKSTVLSPKLPNRPAMFGNTSGGFMVSGQYSF